MDDLLRRLRTTGFARRRGARIFGVGAAKTGTHSVGAMFSSEVPSRHEADAEKLIRLHLERLKTGDERALRRFLRVRDWWRNLKIDASQINVYLIDDLEALFPDSRYVLTVRPPVEWLRSIIDDSLRRDVTETWMRFRDYRFGSKGEHPAQEEPLAVRGLHSLCGYLRYWRATIERALDRIPPDRLLVIETRQLQDRAGEIAAFCGLPPARARAGPTWAYANPERFGVLTEIDPDYLAGTISSVCGDLAQRLFPEVPIAASVAALREDRGSAPPPR